LVSTVLVAGCGNQHGRTSTANRDSSETTAPPQPVLHPGGGPVGALIADAITRLDHHDLIGYCRDFAPGAAGRVAQLPASGNCDDPVLARSIAACPDCRKSDQVISLKVDYHGDSAVAHIKVRNSVSSPNVVTKDVRAVKVGSEWKLLDTPAATVP
jgi:hypothetical protein